MDKLKLQIEALVTKYAKQSIVRKSYEPGDQINYAAVSYTHLFWNTPVIARSAVIAKAVRKEFLCQI